MNVEQFLYHEARLLDTGQFEAWLDLFTEDATYWLPLERDQTGPLETSSIRRTVSAPSVPSAVPFPVIHVISMSWFS